MESNHTEGPWEFDKATFLVHQKNGPTVAIVSYDPINNGPIVAAAPDLLAACKEGLFQLQSNLNDLTDYFEKKHTKDAIDTLKEAIALTETR